MAKQSDPVVALLSPTQLQCYDPYSGLESCLDVSDTLQYGEVVDPQVLLHKLSEFFDQFQLKGRTLLLVFRSELVFGGQAEVTNNNINAVRSTFLESIPFTSQQMRLYQKKTNNLVMWLVINNSIFHLFQESVHAHGGEVKEVLSNLVLPKVATLISLNPDSARQLLHEKKIQDSPRYLITPDQTPSISHPASYSQTNNSAQLGMMKRYFAVKLHRQFAVLGGLLVLLALLAGYVATNYFLL